MLAVLAPGQGAQKSGFLSSWLDLTSFASGLDRLSAVVGMDLATYGTTADDETIRDTAVAQPLLVAAGVLAADELFGPPQALADHGVGVVAGHSVGEITAAIVTGVLSAEDGMTLIRERGTAMAEASAARPTSMTAVIGGDPDEVLAAIAAAGLTAANHNGTGQIVAAGTTEQLATFAEAPPTRARLIPLSVAGAFHTVHMEPAVARLRSAADAMTVADPRTRLLSVFDGAEVSQGRDVLDRIVAQVAAPVRWDLCLATMTTLGVTGVLELTPAGTLTGIAKRNLRRPDGTAIAVCNLNGPADLETARAFVAEHTTEGAR